MLTDVEIKTLNSQGKAPKTRRRGWFTDETEHCRARFGRFFAPGKRCHHRLAMRARHEAVARDGNDPAAESVRPQLQHHIDHGETGVDDQDYILDRSALR